MQKNVETELKLLISKRNLKKLLASDWLQQAVRDGSERQRHLVSSYYDTADWALKRNGIAYRVRDKGDGGYEATVKTTKSNAGGLSERLELNMPLQDANPVLNGFGALGLGYELTDLAPEGVEKLFTVDVMRTTYLLDFGGAVVELAVDNGKLTAGKKHTAIEEIELELKEGELSQLLELASRIADTVPVFAEKRSKFARGLALVGQKSDERTAKAKISGDGNIRQQVLNIVLQRGGALLELQNALNKMSAFQIDSETGKRLTKNLQYLKTMISFGSVFAPSPKAEQADAIVSAWLAALAELDNIDWLEKLWAKISEASESDLSKSVLLEKAAEVKAQQLESLRSFAADGNLTQVVYAAASWLASDQWQNEEYLQPLSTVRCRLQDWQEELETASDDAAKIALLDKILRLGKCVEDKSFARLLKAVKAARSVLQSDLRRKKLQQLTDNINKMGKSRALSREAGIVNGWLLANK